MCINRSCRVPTGIRERCLWCVHRALACRLLDKRFVDDRSGALFRLPYDELPADCALCSGRLLEGEGVSRSLEAAAMGIGSVDALITLEGRRSGRRGGPAVRSARPNWRSAFHRPTAITPKYVYVAAPRFAERVGYRASRGKPVLWKLK
jgi:hypothetical protein